MNKKTKYIQPQWYIYFFLNYGAKATRTLSTKLFTKYYNPNLMNY